MAMAAQGAEADDAGSRKRHSSSSTSTRSAAAGDVAGQPDQADRAVRPGEAGSGEEGAVLLGARPELRLEHADDRPRPGLPDEITARSTSISSSATTRRSVFGVPLPAGVSASRTDTADDSPSSSARTASTTRPRRPCASSFGRRSTWSAERRQVDSPSTRRAGWRRRSR